jgi:CIC family chloride channel protein
MTMDEKEVGQSQPLAPLVFSLLSVLVGLVAGIGAVVFRGLIAVFHNLLFLGKLSATYNANVHTPLSPQGPLVVLVPVLGAIGVAFLVKNFAPEAKGHGVPEVMDAIYYDKGIVRPIVAVIKSLASALSIGSGGSIGREGPIIQIGSSFGSTVGQIIPMPAWQRITLIAAGAGGGIAATFNTPIGGVLFAIEIMMHELSVRTLVPVAIATATATYIGRIAFGDYPSFVIPSFEIPYFHVTNPLVLISYVGLGVLLGIVSAVFIKSIYGFEDFFEKRVRGNYYTRHMIGMFLVGIIMYLLMINFGHYYIEGVGYSTIQDILSNAQSQLFLLLLLFVLKLLATSLTLGSGASGGIFSPSLYMGATLGGAYGIILDGLFPGLAINPPAFAVAGMAGVVGGATGAAVTAIVIIFEMTLDYNVIIPMTITVALSYGVRKFLSPESIYTLKLVRRGHYMPEALQTNFQYLKRARNVMQSNVPAVQASSTIDEFARMAPQYPAASYFLVKDTDRVIGVVSKDAALAALEEARKTVKLGDIADDDFIIVTENTTLFDIIAKMRAHRTAVALVARDLGTKNKSLLDAIVRLRSTGASVAVDGYDVGTVSADDVKGLISKQHIAEVIVEAIEPFSD